MLGKVAEVAFTHMDRAHVGLGRRVRQRELVVWQVHVGCPVDVIPYAHTVRCPASEDGRPAWLEMFVLSAVRREDDCDNPLRAMDATS